MLLQEIDLDVTRSGRRAPTLSTSVYDGIRKDILTCKLSPGQLIFEHEFVAAYEVSNTPVREALKRLAQEGLIQSIPGTGYLVTPLTLKDVRDMFDLRRILEEVSCTRAAAMVTPEQIAELEQMVGESMPLTDEETRIRWHQSNVRFHLAIAAIPGNDRFVAALRKVMEGISRVLLIYLSLSKGTESRVDVHHQIVDALAHGDGKRATELTLAEIDTTMRDVQEALALTIGAR